MRRMQEAAQQPAAAHGPDPLVLRSVFTQNMPTPRANTTTATGHTNDPPPLGSHLALMPYVPGGWWF